MLPFAGNVTAAVVALTATLAAIDQPFNNPALVILHDTIMEIYDLPHCIFGSCCNDVRQLHSPPFLRQAVFGTGRKDSVTLPCFVGNSDMQTFLTSCRDNTVADAAVEHALFSCWFSDMAKAYHPLHTVMPTTSLASCQQWLNVPPETRFARLTAAAMYNEQQRAGVRQHTSLAAACNTTAAVSMLPKIHRATEQVRKAFTQRSHYIRADLLEMQEFVQSHLITSTSGSGSGL